MENSFYRFKIAVSDIRHTTITNNKQLNFFIA